MVGIQGKLLSIATLFTTFYAYFYFYSFLWVRYQFFKFSFYCCANLISTFPPLPPQKTREWKIRSEKKKSWKDSLATSWDISSACFFNGNIIFTVFFARGDLMKSKVIFHFVLGLVGFFHLKASSIKFSRTTFLRTDSSRTETHTNVTLLLKYFQFKTSCLVESRHKTNFAWDAKCKLIRS